MSFVSAEDSFFLDATASANQQHVIQIVPLNDEDVFDYLDAHPDVLLRYLRERPGVLGSFSETPAQGEHVLEEAASENEVTTTAGEQAVLEESSDDFQELAWLPVVDAEQAVEEWDGEDVFAEDNAADGSSDDGNDDSIGTSTVPSNDGANNTMIPYPAPAHLIAESRKQPPTRSWALWEEDACIRHMLNINRERQLTGEARFREALRRMQVHNNVNRTGHSAVKNFWNRVGRARSLFDERRNKKAPLATSKQCKRAHARPNAASSSPQQRKITKSFRVTKSRRNSRRSRSSPKLSKEDDEESDYSIQSDNEERVHLRHSRKRKDRGDDSEDDWQPDSAYVNAVAKGLRAPKRMREAGNTAQRERGRS